MTDILFINWLIDPVIGDVFGRSIRWYGLFFGSGFLIGYSIMHWLFAREGKGLDQIDNLALFMAAGVFIGARLGHCLFYEPDFYLSNPLEMLKLWKGGLSSHGGAIGVITSLILFSKFFLKKSPLWILDRIVLVVALGGGFIRMGNLMNSEIVGSETSKPWGFVFQSQAGPDQLGPYFYAGAEEGAIEVFFQKTEEHDLSKIAVATDLAPSETYDNWQQVKGEADLYNVIIPTDDFGKRKINLLHSTAGQLSQINFMVRHPSQLYEALMHFAMFIILLILNFKLKGNWYPGRLFGLYLVLIFLSRILIEFFKKEQVAFELEMLLNLGQALSIPLVIMGFYYLLRPATKGEGVD